MHSKTLWRDSDATHTAEALSALEAVLDPCGYRPRARLIVLREAQLFRRTA
jgi:hypothetical protein